MPKSKELALQAVILTAKLKKKVKEKKASCSRKLCEEAKASGETCGALASSEQSSSSRDDTMFQVGKRDASVLGTLRGNSGIREHGMASEGEMGAGRKGISLNMEQCNQLKEQLSDIEDAESKL